MNSKRSSLRRKLSKAPERSRDVSIHEPPHPVAGRVLQAIAPGLIHVAERTLFFATRSMLCHIDIRG